MTKQRPFRFSVSVHDARSKEEWIATARKAEALGYSAFLMPDHLGDQFAPIPALLAVAEATQNIRIGTLVFDNDFRHPVMLAKEAATLDILSDGRFELGLGAGWLRSEYEHSGIPFDAPGVRLSRMEESLQIIKKLFTEESVSFAGKYYTLNNFKGYPKPVQKPYPPIMVGGGGKRLLSIAAREATIIGFIPVARADGKGQDLADATPQRLAQKLEWVREAAGDRFDDLELNVLVAEVGVNDNREQVAQFIAATMAPGIAITPEQVLEVPYLLIGTVEQICEDLSARRERYGISYITVFEKNMEMLAPVVERLAGK